MCIIAAWKTFKRLNRNSLVDKRGLKGQWNFFMAKARVLFPVGPQVSRFSTVKNHSCVVGFYLLELCSKFRQLLRGLWHKFGTVVGFKPCLRAPPPFLGWLGWSRSHNKSIALSFFNHLAFLLNVLPDMVATWTNVPFFFRYHQFLPKGRRLLDYTRMGLHFRSELGKCAFSQLEKLLPSHCVVLASCSPLAPIQRHHA